MIFLLSTKPGSDMSYGMNLETEKLVEMAKEGNENAMRILYDTHRQRIFNLAYGYTRNPEEAEDVLQETFFKAFTSLRKNRLNDNRVFPSWLYRIGINTSITLVKKRSRTRSQPIDDKDTFSQRETIHPQPTPEDNTLQAEMESRIQGAVAKLAPKQRMIFTLKHFQQMKIREIAESLHCSEGNVKQQLHRAVNRLRRELRPQFDEVNHGL
jgi:RNA polymerase sigma-70 factor (ECF subfamily)